MESTKVVLFWCGEDFRELFFFLSDRCHLCRCYQNCMGDPSIFFQNSLDYGCYVPKSLMLNRYLDCGLLIKVIRTYCMVVECFLHRVGYCKTLSAIFRGVGCWDIKDRFGQGKCDTLGSIGKNWISLDPGDAQFRFALAKVSISYFNLKNGELFVVYIDSLRIV